MNTRLTSNTILRASRLMLLLLCVSGVTEIARADVKIKSRQTTQGQTYENATYIKGKRQRTEQMGGQMITIQQCDLRRDLQLMPQARVYTVTPYTNPTTTIANASDVRPSGVATKGGVVTSTVTLKDTGERKQMFGYTARHIITTIVTESSPDSCAPVNSKMEMDGWYIDAAFQLDCERERSYTPYNPQQRQNGCQDRYQTKQIGAAKKGFALWEEMTMFGTEGKESFSMINEVVELSQATLDAALFDAPADYREVKDFSGAAMMASNNSSADDDGGMNHTSSKGTSSSSSDAGSGISANVKSMANAGTAVNAGAVGAKKPGIVRLGLVAVKTGSVGEGLNANDLAAAVGNTLDGYLKSPRVELVQLEARLPSQIEDEAREKECDFVIYANVSHKKGGGGGFGGMFSKVVAPTVRQVGIGHTGSTAGNVAGEIATHAIVSAGTMSASVKAKDELTLDIRVQASGNVTASQQFKSKAKSAGEDIITPLVEQAAQLILDAAIKR